MPRARSSLPFSLCRIGAQDNGKAWALFHSVSASLRHPGHAPTVMVVKGTWEELAKV